MNPNVRPVAGPRCVRRPHLEIGTGSGYVTARLATLGSSVLSVDIHADFTETAQAWPRLPACTMYSCRPAMPRAAGATLLRRDRDHRSLPVLDPLWRDLLTVGGRLFAGGRHGADHGSDPVTRVGVSREWTSEACSRRTACLLNSARPPVFTF